MILETLSLNKSLNPAYRKQSLKRDQIDVFKSNLARMFSRINEAESEENQKNNVADFLKDTYYKHTNEINTKGRKDLVIHNDKTANSTVGVIIEVKRPSNKSEMISKDKPNAKALQELLHYYLHERYIKNNKDIKHLIITNIYEWFIFDGAEFERFFFEHPTLKNKYKEWNDGLYGLDRTDWFYTEMAQPFIEKELTELTCSYFNLREFETILSEDNHNDEQKLLDLFKILSPEHLLKKPFTNDSNTLNKNFYNELLHIIGLEETKDAGKKIIRRKNEKERNPGSLLENTILECETKIRQDGITVTPSEGRTKEEEIFSIALELCITWLNRILFLKLLEGQLIKYHKGDRQYSFLNGNHISAFRELNDLFFEVLARKTSERDPHILSKFENIPYLNSSLFDITEFEQVYTKIKDLRDGLEIPVFSQSVLKSAIGNKISGNKNTLHYLFEFLDAYDFASDSAAEIQEQNKTIINASVLGLIFEKINGYKDGSIFTPGFITMYMCRETIRRAVVEKFNERFGWMCVNFTDLFNKLGGISLTEANATVNSLKICDPAVGSGHFLVSALNEIISIKSELQILTDSTGKLLRGYKIIIENDELIITYDEEIFSYNYKNQESQRVQETLFHEKQTIIENCLFGVDINPKSVMICRLRLWIELLKNAYYKRDTNSTELETLPNIDINIKCGNSLLSRFALDADLSKALKSIKYDINAYRGFVQEYKNATSRELKRGLVNIINSIKNDFRTEILNNDPKLLRHSKLSGELLTLLTQTTAFEPTPKEKKEQKAKQVKLEADITKLAREIEDIKSNALYKNAFEWRFEFPEVLNDNGDFVGFDVVIGNPPYIQLQSMGKDADILATMNYHTYLRTGDIYCLFYEHGYNILKSSGQVCFITSNKWMKAEYGKVLRSYLATNTQLITLVDLGNAQIFESATIDTIILVFSKNERNGTTKATRLITGEYDNLNITHYIENNFILIDNSTWTEASWVISDSNSMAIQSKVKAQGIALINWDVKINRGLLTGFNKAFIITQETKDDLIKSDPKSREVIKPILSSSRNIERWFPIYENKYLILIKGGWTNSKRNGEAPEIFIKKSYPAVYEFIKKQGDNYMGDDKGLYNRLDQGDYWWELRKCAYYEDFEKPKLIFLDITKYFPFVYDDANHFFTTDRFFIMTGSYLKYLTSFFNSKLFYFCFADNFPELKGGSRKLQKIFFEQIPVKQISKSAQQPFIKTVDKILKAKQAGKDTTALEQEIDRMVYTLYGLTEEEIAVVEGK